MKAPPIQKTISVPPATVPMPRCRVTESIATYGPETLSDAQLVSTMLNTFTPDRAETLLASAGSMGNLLRCGPAELRDLGLTDLEASRLAALPELLRRSTRAGMKRIKVCSPFQALAYLRPRCAGWAEERFGMLGLNAKGEIIADREISKGTATATPITPREFFREALRYGAISALAWHNHPSGDPAPSGEDWQLTKRLRAAGEGLGIPLLDHIIIGKGRNYSFREAQGNWDG